jgi:anaerobic selenocysteine-containing dehydrogenase
MSGSEFSRRNFLKAAAIAGGAALTPTLATTPARAANKVPQKAVSYQATPKGPQRCDNCAFWQTPDACKLVDGKIDAAGWCTLYRKK